MLYVSQWNFRNCLGLTNEWGGWLRYSWNTQWCVQSRLTTCTVQTVHTTCTESQLCQSSLGGREWSGISRPSTTNNIAGFLWNVNHMRIVSVGVTRNLKFTMTFPWELEKRGLVSADYIRHSLQSHLAITFTNCLHLFSFKILINQWNNIKKFQLINILRNDIEDFLHHGI